MSVRASRCTQIVCRPIRRMQMSRRPNRRRRARDSIRPTPNSSSCTRPSESADDLHTRRTQRAGKARKLAQVSFSCARWLARARERECRFFTFSNRQKAAELSTLERRARVALFSGAPFRRERDTQVSRRCCVLWRTVAACVRFGCLSHNGRCRLCCAVLALFASSAQQVYCRATGAVQRSPVLRADAD